MHFTTFLAQAASGGGSMITTVVMFGAIFAIFYFMIIRPQQRRAKEQAAMLGQVKRGDKVLMSGGIHGTVHEVEEKSILVEVARNTVIKFEKAAVQTIFPAE